MDKRVDITFAFKALGLGCPYLVLDNGNDICLKCTKEDGLEIYVYETCPHRCFIIGAVIAQWARDEQLSESCSTERFGQLVEIRTQALIYAGGKPE